MIRTFLAFCVAAILATASLQAMPSRQVFNLDTKDCSAIAGWIFDRDNPSQSVKVSVYEGGKVVESMLANGMRPDVNAAFGIQGNHGFHFHTPAIWALNDGEPHTLHVVMDVVTVEAELPSEEKAAEKKYAQSFTIQCGTPTLVAGEMRSEFGDWVLATDGFFNARLTLYRTSKHQADEYVNSSDCYAGQGCVVAGTFSFSRGHDGRLPDGNYLLTGEAEAHLKSDDVRFKIVGGVVQGSLPVIVLKMAPVYAQVLSTAAYIPKTGGSMSIRLAVWNLNWNKAVLGSQALVMVALNGPTKTMGQTTTPSWTWINVPAEVGSYGERVIDVWISGNRPDGKQYSADLKVGSAENYEDVFWQGWANVVKGVTPSLPGVPMGVVAAREDPNTYFAMLRKKQ